MKKKNGYGKGTFIDSKMFLSDAFLSLGQPGSCSCVSSVSAQVLIMFLGKRQFGTVKNHKNQKAKARTDDNKFTLTYKEIQSYGSRTSKGERVNGMITQPQVTRAIDELLAKGFIEIIEHGGAFDKHKSIYALSDSWINWHWGAPPIRERKRDIRRGFQAAGKGAANQISHT